MPLSGTPSDQHHYFTVCLAFASGKTLKSFRARAGFSASLFVAFALLIGSGNIANAMSITASKASGSFAPTSLDDWSERSFSGKTDYQLVEDSGLRVLKGHTQGKASILYREQTVDLTKNPVIHWSWKVDRTYMNIDEQAREGDDFPARLYVVAQVGFLPWETVAINYVWASEVAEGESWTNPHTNKAKMIAVQSGNAHVGSWTVQSRNVVEDFKTRFGMDIKELSGFAVMVDGDNGRREATAWFGEIDFSKN
jgi:hypothetical protein